MNGSLISLNKTVIYPKTPIVIISLQEGDRFGIPIVRLVIFPLKPTLYSYDNEPLEGTGLKEDLLDLVVKTGLFSLKFFCTYDTTLRKTFCMESLIKGTKYLKI